MPIDDISITALNPASGGCICGSAGCGGSCASTQSPAAQPPIFGTDAPVCTCAMHDQIAADYQASLAADFDSLMGWEANTILSSHVDGPLMLNDASQTPIPGGMQFYLQFQLNWQGDDREEFQVLAKVATPQSASTNQIELKQVYGTPQVQLLVEVNGQEKSFVVDGVMVNSDRNWIIQVTDQGQAQLIIDGTLRGQMFVGDISSIPRDLVTLGKTDFGMGNQVWGEFSNVRADVDGDGLQDVVQVPPPRLPVPFTPEPIPDLPNPNPDGFTNTALIPNADRINLIPDSGNPIIDTLALGAGWKGDTITYSFHVQDIDNNGIADFDEGGWRPFYAHMLGNVTQFTGVDFWERPEGIGTIEYNLAPGGGGVSGTPGLGAAPNTGTIVGITGAVADVGLNVGAFNFTRTWFHETGHALGLAHPHDYENPNGIDTGIDLGRAGISQPGDHFLNSKLYASTSYAGKFWGEDNPFTDGVDFGTNLDGLDQSTFLPFDIAALQRIYGVNPTFALGNDLYTFNDSGTQSQGLRTIWDNGGTDTIQYTGGLRSVINLNDATIRQEVGGGGFLSTSESLDAGFLIANGVTIENAIGGEKQDFITGNEVANTLTGNGGNDVIKGGDGDDTLIGGTGSDTLDGGSDMDVANLSGARTDYSWSSQADNTWTFTHTPTGAVDTLRDIETVRFDATGETVVLSATPFTARPLEITQPPPVVPGPAFYAEAAVRFDNLSGGAWQRVFDFGNGAGQQNILLTQVASSNSIRIEYYLPTTVFALEIPGIIVQGQTATWRVEISELGNVKVYKDGVVVGSGNGPPLPDVPRTNLLVGSINFRGDTPLIGEVLSFAADINGDGILDVQRGTAAPQLGTVDGTTGNDLISINFMDAEGDNVDGVDGANDRIDAGGGNDTVSFGLGNDTVFGGGGDDVISAGTPTDATTGNALIYGGVGNDTISDTAGSDTIYGGAGRDLLNLQSGGNDVVDGGEGNDTLDGGAGNDTLTVGAGDVVRGGDGADTFTVDVTTLDANGQTLANSTVDGGAGNDVLDLQNAGNWRILNPVTDANGTHGTVQFLGSAGVATGRLLNFTGIETILGTAFVRPNDAPIFANLTEGQTVSIPENTTLVIDANASDANSDPLIYSIVGGADAARFTINPTTGVLSFVAPVDFEGAGSATGNDQVYEVTIRVADDWGGQKDTALLVNVTDVVEVQPNGIVDGTAGNDTLNPGFADAQGEVIDGADGLNDVINAGAGNDVVDAGLGDDLLYGDLGNDTLNGNAGADTLYGGAGNDSVQNGIGRDLVYGGDGDDRLIDTAGFNSTSDADTVYGDAGNDTIEGTSSNDLLFGGADNDRLVGEAGNDLLDGGLGDDILLGEDGNDTVSGSDGNDTLFGAAGDDALDGGAGNDSVLGGAGNDSVLGGDGTDTLIGGLGNDTLDGGLGDDDIALGGADSALGGSGDDVFTIDPTDTNPDLAATIVGGELGEDLNDPANGGAGDTLDLSGVSAPVTVALGNESGTVNGLDADGTPDITFSEIEKILTGTGADTIAGGAATAPVNLDTGAGNDSIATGSGNDTIAAGTGDDTVDAGAGNDSVDAGTGNDSIAAGAGDDTVAAGDGNDTVDGGLGNDSIDAGAGNDSVAAGDGNDTVAAGAGNDTVDAGAGNDSVDAGAGNDSVLGGAGNDSVLGGDGTDTLIGGLGNDTLDGGLGDDDIALGGADSALGGSGDDVFTIDPTDTNPDLAATIVGGELGEDLTDPANGGAGDTLDLSGVSAPVTVALGNESGTVNGLDADGTPDITFSEIEKILTGTGADTIAGGAATAPVNLDTGAGNDSIATGSGNDTIAAGTGDDTVDAGAGNDSVDAGTGNDSIAAGAGDDTVAAGDGNDTVDGGLGNDSIDAGAGNDSVAAGDGNDTVAAGAGNDTVDAGAGNDSVDAGAGDDTVDAGAGNDTVAAGDGNDTVDGGTGDDTIGGGLGNDSLIGGAGNDSLDGGDGNDTVDGGTGDDTIGGGLGNDSLIGGAGNDTLDGGDGSDTLAGGEGSDVLTGGLGDDDIVVGAGDLANGGSGDDVFTVNAALTGNAPVTIVGGELGEDLTDPSNGGAGDVLDLRGLTNVVVTPTGAESGTATYLNAAGATVTITYSEIETILRDPAGVVDGTVGSDTMNPGYTDPQGDQIDGTDGLNDTISAGTGNDIVDAGLGDDTVYGGAGNDSLLGNVGNDSIFGDAGNDTLDGGDGNDTLDGGADDDSLIGGAGNDTLAGGDGNDTLDGGADNDSLAGGLGQDSLLGGLGNDTLDGGDGNDTLDAGDGNDSLAGGLGQDSLIGGAGNDTLDGGDGTDTLEGGLGEDRISAGAGPDSVTAGDGNDVVDAGAGNDTIYGGAGNDTVDGGDGDDFINTRTTVGNGIPNQGLTIPGNPAFSYAADPNPNDDRDSVIGGLGNDTLLTGDDNDTVYGGVGNDSIDAGFDDDVVDGGDGNDSIAGNEGRDTVYGGVGDDTIFGALADTDPNFAASAVYDLPNAGGADPVTTNSTDALYGGVGNDLVYGGEDDDSIFGGVDNDTIYGGIDDDFLNGDAGNDRVFGDQGNDILTGGAGNDSLDGGIGNDTIDGDIGSDTLSGGEGRDILSGGDGDDDIILGASDQGFGDGGDDVFSINTALTGTATVQVRGGETGEDASDPSNGSTGDTLDLTGGRNVQVTYNQADPTFNGTTSESGTATYLNAANQTVTVNFAEIEKVVVCFAAGTMIETAEGEVAIEQLQVGDLVRTADHDYQPIRWIGSSKVAAVGAVAPILIKAGALGNARDLMVSPQHRMLLGGWQAEMLFGDAEVLVAAKHLVNDQTILRAEGGEVEYFHMLFDTHEIVFAEGAPSESFHPGEIGWGALAEEARAEILALFPELEHGQFAGYGTSARRTLKAHEAKTASMLGIW